VGRRAAAADGQVVTLHQYDPETGGGVIIRAQDVEPIFEENARLYTLNDGYSPRRELRRVASIPVSIAEQWYREGVNVLDKNCREEVRRRLNDPVNLKLRTAPGRV
jgi:hypothetical protein